MKSFAVCFICRNILCVLTSHQTCQGKQMQPCGKQLGPTVTPVLLTCSGQLFHRAELIKMPIAWVTRCNNHLCNQPFRSQLFSRTWLGWEFQFKTVMFKIDVRKLLLPNQQHHLPWEVSLSLLCSKDLFQVTISERTLVLWTDLIFSTLVPMLSSLWFPSSYQSPYSDFEFC